MTAARARCTPMRHGVPLALLCALCLLLAACTPGDATPGPTPGRPGLGAPATVGPPRQGGTLRLGGSGDVDSLDTASAASNVAFTLLRAITRQPYSYPASPDQAMSYRPAPDLAEAPPEVSDNGRTYTFSIRQGAQWDAPGGPRQISARDQARGLKRLCAPKASGGNALAYLENVIVGMRDYCAGLARVPVDVAPVKGYIEGREIPGVTVVGERTVRIELVRPTPDFVNMLAMPFSSPAPVEALDSFPGSPELRRGFVSSGPYKLSRYVADRSIELVRNPAWRPESDPLRKAYVDRITVEQGLPEDSVQRQLEADALDMSWDTKVPTAAIPQLLASRDARLHLNDSGQVDYIPVNLQSPREGGALRRLEVRQALNYAINRSALVQQLGGPALRTPQHTVLPPSMAGFSPYNLYPTPGDAGDPEKARQLLAQAGYPGGLRLVLLHRTEGKDAAIAQTLQSDLRKAGVELELKPVPPKSFYVDFLDDPESGRRGEWDLAIPSWAPDWQGYGARSVFVPLLYGRNLGQGSSNYGRYDSPRVNSLIEQAVSAPSPDEAARIWAQADRAVMEDAAWVPMLTGKTPSFHSARTQNWIYSFLLDNGDLTNVWLSR